MARQGKQEPNDLLWSVRSTQRGTRRRASAWVNVNRCRRSGRPRTGPQSSGRRRGNETLAWLERAADDLARAYARTSPRDLLPWTRRYVRYCHRLLDARMTLGQQRRLMIVAGWFTLLSATVHIDLRQHSAADAELMASFELARHADFPEIAAWSVETRSWEALTNGQFRLADDLSQQAQTLAPRNGSAYIQATAQEGRAHSRMSNRRGILDALARTAGVTRAGPRIASDLRDAWHAYHPARISEQ